MYDDEDMEVDEGPDQIVETSVYASWTSAAADGRMSPSQWREVQGDGQIQSIQIYIGCLWDRL